MVMARLLSTNMTCDLQKTGDRVEKSIERRLQPREGHAQVLFDHVAGNAKPLGDFLLMQILEPAHDKHLPAAGRELVDGLDQKF
jgi:hypothetical protein